MKIIIPMAGMGTRMRPHSLTVPKPLIPVAGKPIVQRLCEDIAAVCKEPIEEIAFIIGNFGKQVEDNLLAIAQKLGAKGSIYYQQQALGTAHAVYCAEPSLSGNVIVAFADTLFFADFKLEKEKDSIIWVHKVDDPSQFGVVTIDGNNQITDFVEKPKTFVSDLAIIGIYYFKDGDNLKNELKYLLDNNITVKGEYQLTDALQNMKNKGLKFSTGQVREWLDCGNKTATLLTNNRILHNLGSSIAPKTVTKNSVIIEPCFIGEDVEITDSVVGPYVSIGAGSKISKSVIEDAIIQSKTSVKNAVLHNSMIGSNASVSMQANVLNMGDFTAIEN